MLDRLLRNSLLPMLPGSVLSDQIIVSPGTRQAVVFEPSSNTIILSAAAGAKTTYHLRRKQPFQESEVRLAEVFVRASSFVRGADGQPFEHDVLRHFPERVIAFYVAEEARQSAMSVLAQFQE